MVNRLSSADSAKPSTQKNRVQGVLVDSIEPVVRSSSQYDSQMSYGILPFFFAVSSHQLGLYILFKLLPLIHNPFVFGFVALIRYFKCQIQHKIFSCIEINKKFRRVSLLKIQKFCYIQPPPFCLFSLFLYILLSAHFNILSGSFSVYGGSHTTKPALT